MVTATKLYLQNGTNKIGMAVKVSETSPSTCESPRGFFYILCGKSQPQPSFSIENWVDCTPPKFNIAPEQKGLEDYFPFGKVTFQGQTVKLQVAKSKLSYIALLGWFGEKLQIPTYLDVPEI